MAYANGREKHARGRAFALAEALVVALVVGLLVAVLVVSGERARRTAMMGEDLSNLRQIGQLTGQYANDFEDKIWSFSWKKGQSLSQFPDLNNAGTDLQAAGNQAVDIMRRLGGLSPAQAPKQSAWLAFSSSNHLPLIEYAGLQTPSLDPTKTSTRMFIGSGDKVRLLWASDLDGFLKNKFLPLQPTGSSGIGFRFPFQSSYRVPFHLISASFGQFAISSVGWNTYTVLDGATFDAKTLSSVVFPSNKVMFHETHGRHYGQRQPFFSVDTGEARVPLLTVDGAADVRATRDGNKGWVPSNPNSTSPTQYQYNPSVWDPPTVSGGAIDQCYGSYDYTRSAEKGRDFGGPEVPFQP
jgi:type II secretory pathway pseudopilin PulG